MREKDRAGRGGNPANFQAEPTLHEALCKKWVCDIYDTNVSGVPSYYLHIILHITPLPKPMVHRPVLLPCLAHGKK